MGITLTLVIVNAVFAVGGGVLLARRMARGRGRKALVGWLLGLGGMYVVECAAFSASMATNVLGFALAVVWGLVLRRKLAPLPWRERVGSAAWVALYTCLPAVSFASVLPWLAVEGWALWSRQAGYEFGVPEIVPWPFCTVAGFFAAVIGSAVVVKTVVTTAIAAGGRRNPAGSEQEGVDSKGRVG